MPSRALRNATYTCSVFAIRQPVVDDAHWLTQACQDSEIQRWTLIPKPYNHEHAQQFIANEIGEAHRWVIEDSATKETVGVISIHTIDVLTGAADIGYWIASWGRRRGAAMQAVLLVEQFALAIPSIQFLSAHIAESNTASRAVASRAGFTNMGNTPATCPDGGCQVAALTYSKQLTR